jgi:hypothetical protein
MGGTGPDAFPNVTIMPRRLMQSSESMKTSLPTEDDGDAFSTGDLFHAGDDVVLPR